MFDKLYQDPEGRTYHLYTATDGVLTVARSESGKGITSMKGFNNLYEVELYLKSKRAESVA